MQESRRVPGRYIVYFIIAFAVFCAAFATWGIRVLRSRPRPKQGPPEMIPLNPPGAMR
jgi:hypothetical protein